MQIRNLIQSIQLSSLVRILHRYKPHGVNNLLHSVKHALLSDTKLTWLPVSFYRMLRSHCRTWPIETPWRHGRMPGICWAASLRPNFLYTWQSAKDSALLRPVSRCLQTVGNDLVKAMADIHALQSKLEALRYVKDSEFFYSISWSLCISSWSWCVPRRND